MESEAGEAIAGALLGVALGDSIGLPYEGLSAARAARWYGPAERQRLIAGRGLVSDDTEHSCMVAQALIAAGDDPERFARALAWRLRGWLLALPGGAGMATLRAIAKLCVGFGPASSGVFSAGNGPAMRAPLLGAAIADRELLARFVRASTRLTHTDPRAEHGAYAVALAARHAADGRADPRAWLAELREALGPEAEELLARLEQAVDSAERGRSARELAVALGLERGVSGFVLDTVPIALHGWLSHPRDLRAAVAEVVACGGDADTTAAIAGGVVGAGLGRGGLPEDWLASLAEWPASVAWMERLAAQLARRLAGGEPERPLAVAYPLRLARNLVFLAIVMAHGFRRLLPPY